MCFCLFLFVFVFSDFKESKDVNEMYEQKLIGLFGIWIRQNVIMMKLCLSQKTCKRILSSKTKENGKWRGEWM